MDAELPSRYIMHASPQSLLRPSTSRVLYIHPPPLPITPEICTFEEGDEGDDSLYNKAGNLKNDIASSTVFYLSLSPPSQPPLTQASQATKTVGALIDILHPLPPAPGFNTTDFYNTICVSPLTRQSYLQPPTIV